MTKGKAQINQTNKSAHAIDTTPSVSEIGGIFFFTEDADKTKKWYEDNLNWRQLNMVRVLNLEMLMPQKKSIEVV